MAPDDTDTLADLIALAVMRSVTRSLRKAAVHVPHAPAGTVSHHPDHAAGVRSPGATPDKGHWVTIHGHATYIDDDGKFHFHGKDSPAADPKGRGFHAAVATALASPAHGPSHPRVRAWLATASDPQPGTHGFTRTRRPREHQLTTHDSLSGPGAPAVDSRYTGRGFVTTAGSDADPQTGAIGVVSRPSEVFPDATRDQANQRAQEALVAGHARGLAQYAAHHQATIAGNADQSTDASTQSWQAGHDAAHPLDPLPPGNMPAAVSRRAAAASAAGAAVAPPPPAPSVAAAQAMPAPGQSSAPLVTLAPPVPPVVPVTSVAPVTSVVPVTPVSPASASTPPRVPFDGTGLDFRPVSGRVLPDDLRGARLEGANLVSFDLSGRDLSGANLAGANLYQANLSGTNLSGANLSASNRRGFRRLGANLSGANLSGANLAGAGLESANLSGANLADANVSRVTANHADLSRADLPRANLSGSDFTSAHLFRADLSGANFTGASLRSTNLTEAVLRDADLSGAQMLLANLTNADLSGAGMTGADLILANLTGATCRDASGQTVPFTLASIGSMPSRPAAPSGTATPATPVPVNAPAPIQSVAPSMAPFDGTGLDFSRASGNILPADLRSATLADAFLADVDLSGRNLTDANLNRATLINANLTGATLSGATLAGAYMTGASLASADLTGADLTGADLTGADLTGADFTDADLLGTRFGSPAIRTAIHASAYGSASPVTQSTPAPVNASPSMPPPAGLGAQPNAPSFPLPPAAPAPAPEPIGDAPDWGAVFPRHLTRDTMLGGRRLGDWSDAHAEGTSLRGDSVPGGSSFRHQGVPFAPGRSILRVTGPDVTTTSRFTETPQDGPGAAGKIAPYTISVHDGRTGAHLSEYHSGASRNADAVAFRTRQVANWAWHNATANRDIATST